MSHTDGRTVSSMTDTDDSRSERVRIQSMTFGNDVTDGMGADLNGTMAYRIVHPVRALDDPSIEVLAVALGDECPGEHPDDMHHVMLDAISALRKRIASGDKPWDAYDPGGVFDPKTERASYMMLLDKAERLHRSALDGSDPKRFTVTP